MITRRQFCATAASAAILVRAPNALAQTSYELIIKGGRVIDPSVGVDGIRDVAISAGKIAAVAPDIAAGAADTIDARGKLVVPGLIDIHTHAGRSKDGPAMCFDWLLGVLLGIQLIAKGSLLAIWLGRCVRVDHRGQKSAPFFARARTKGGKCE